MRFYGASRPIRHPPISDDVWKQYLPVVLLALANNNDNALKTQKWIAEQKYPNFNPSYAQLNKAIKSQSELQSSSASSDCLDPLAWPQVDHSVGIECSEGGISRDSTQNPKKTNVKHRLSSTSHEDTSSNKKKKRSFSRSERDDEVPRLADDSSSLSSSTTPDHEFRMVFETYNLTLTREDRARRFSNMPSKSDEEPPIRIHQDDLHLDDQPNVQPLVISSDVRDGLISTGDTDKHLRKTTASHRVSKPLDHIDWSRVAMSPPPKLGKPSMLTVDLSQPPHTYSPNEIERIEILADFLQLSGCTRHAFQLRLLIYNASSFEQSRSLDLLLNCLVSAKSKEEYVVLHSLLKNRLLQLPENNFLSSERWLLLVYLSYVRGWLRDLDTAQFGNLSKDSSFYKHGQAPESEPRLSQKANWLLSCCSIFSEKACPICRRNITHSGHLASDTIHQRGPFQIRHGRPLNHAVRTCLEWSGRIFGLKKPMGAQWRKIRRSHSCGPRDWSVVYWYLWKEFFAHEKAEREAGSILPVLFDHVWGEVIASWTGISATEILGVISHLIAKRMSIEVKPENLKGSRLLWDAETDFLERANSAVKRLKALSDQQLTRELTDASPALFSRRWSSERLINNAITIAAKELHIALPLRLDKDSSAGRISIALSETSALLSINSSDWSSMRSMRRIAHGRASRSISSILTFSNRTFKAETIEVEQLSECMSIMSIQSDNASEASEQRRQLDELASSWKWNISTPEVEWVPG